MLIIAFLISIILLFTFIKLWDFELFTFLENLTNYVNNLFDFNTKFSCGLDDTKKDDLKCIFYFLLWTSLYVYIKEHFFHENCWKYPCYEVIYKKDEKKEKEKNKE